MPTYEYLCRTCGHRFETWQKMTDEPLTVCPECGQEIRRVLFPAGVVFKGSGFYKTDYSSNGLKNSASSTTDHNDNHSESKAGSESKTNSESTTSKSDSTASTTNSSTSSSATPASAS